MKDITILILSKISKLNVDALPRGFRMGNKNSTTRHYCNKCGL